jgi:hypothetical protein
VQFARVRLHELVFSAQLQRIDFAIISYCINALILDCSGVSGLMDFMVVNSSMYLSVFMPLSYSNNFYTLRPLHEAKRVKFLTRTSNSVILSVAKNPAISTSCMDSSLRSE